MPENQPANPTPPAADEDDAIGLASEEDQRRGADPGADLAETVAEMDAGPLAADGTIPIADNEWTKQFGGALDPEAGIYRVADKRFSLRHITGSALAQLITSLVWFLAGSTLLVFALILQDDYFVYPAPVLVPLAYFMCVRTWRWWKGRALFTDRLVETLDGPQTPDGSLSP